jgi:16S rRNA processing protein RimM
MPDVRYVPLGRVSRTHGLHGEVSVIPAGLPFVLPAGLRVRFVPPVAGVGEIAVESVRPGPKGPLVKLAGIDDIDAASRIAGTTMVCRAEDAPETALDAEDAFDATGLSVFDEKRGELGIVEDVIVTGANDVWVVHGERFGEVLVPVIADVVLGVDEETRCARIRLLPGLIEEGE